VSSMLASHLYFACSARHRNVIKHVKPLLPVYLFGPIPCPNVTHMQHTYNTIQRTFNMFNSHHGSNGSRRFASSALRCSGYGTDQLSK
jgi:hypothetical protein